MKGYATVDETTSAELLTENGKASFLLRELSGSPPAPVAIAGGHVALRFVAILWLHLLLAHCVLRQNQSMARNAQESKVDDVPSAAVRVAVWSIDRKYIVG